MEGATHFNHKWSNNHSHSTCLFCNCVRDKSGLTVRYYLNGERLDNAPSCVKKPKKKYPSKYGKPLRKPKGYDKQTF